MRRAWQTGLYLIACAVIAVCLAALSSRWVVTCDWSAGARASITPQSQALLENLRGPLEVTVFARPGSLRAKASWLLQRYQRYKPDLSIHYVDPDLDPGATLAAGIEADGELLWRWRAQTERVDSLSETDIADALVRLARGPTRLVAFVTGAGERDASGSNAADLGNFTARLSRRGVRVAPLNLAEAAEVPRNTDLVVLASPQARMLPASTRKLQDYLANGGNLLWLSEPGSDELGLAPLAEDLGIKHLPGVLLDATALAAGMRDAATVVVSRYPDLPPVQGFSYNTLFPHAAALAARVGAPWNSASILQTSPRSWIGATATTAIPASAAAQSDAAHGPYSFGYALSRLSPSPAKNQQRAVVIGDGDFLANAWIDDAGNRALGERIVDWLLADDALAQLPPPPVDAALKPTRLTLGILAYGYLLVLPALLILLGAWLGWRRRRQ